MGKVTKYFEEYNKREGKELKNPNDRLGLFVPFASFLDEPSVALRASDYADIKI